MIAKVDGAEKDEWQKIPNRFGTDGRKSKIGWSYDQPYKIKCASRGGGRGQDARATSSIESECDIS
jgi:hypothetical protein